MSREKISKSILSTCKASDRFRLSIFKHSYISETCSPSAYMPSNESIDDQTDRNYL